MYTSSTTPIIASDLTWYTNSDASHHVTSDIANLAIDTKFEGNQ